jgi:hypothetical protein
LSLIIILEIEGRKMIELDKKYEEGCMDIESDKRYEDGCIDIFGDI